MAEAAGGRAAGRSIGDFPALGKTRSGCREDAMGPPITSE
jgi:hypothetical protein